MEDPREIARRNARLQKSARGQTARDRWIAAQGGEEANKERIAAGVTHSDDYLDVLLARWELAVKSITDSDWKSAAHGARVARLRRRRRRQRLILTLASLSIGSGWALIIWYGFLGHR